ncbi:MAG: acyltransferase [Methanosarcinales archaeon]
MRIRLYRLSGCKIGKNVFIGMGCYFDDFVPGRIIIEDGALISFRVTCIAHGPLRGNWKREITIGKNAWIGANVVIHPGVTIGESAAIGAGTVVARDVPPHSIVIGVPKMHLIGKVEDENIMEDYMKKRAQFEEKS